MKMFGIRTSKPQEIENFLLVIGAMKSGTTTLFQYLGQHPEIAASRRKEPNFFGSKRQRVRGRDFYLGLWPKFDPATHRYALEASTHYTKGKTRAVGRRIREFGGDFRFIYILRNPVDRIESQLAHNIAKERIGFERADPSRNAIRVSSYARQLDAFRAGFRNDPKLLLLDFDELRRAPLATMERCTRFLDLDPSFRFTEIAPANQRKAANRAAEFRLSPEARARLAKRLRPEVVALRDRYGFDISGWGLV